MNGADIFKKFSSLGLDYKDFDWFEDKGLSEFELLVSVILTQNTKWDNVLKVLLNLRKAKISSLERLESLDETNLATLIKPSGFYNTKAKRLKNLVSSILKDFSDLENFKQSVSRTWLLSVKGLGFESVDSILNYLCKKEILVVDSYTNRLALALGYEFEDYESLQEFFQSGIENEQESLCEILGQNYELYELYQIFHAQIITFAKVYFKGKSVSEAGKEILNSI